MYRDSTDVLPSIARSIAFSLERDRETHVLQTLSMRLAMKEEMSVENKLDTVSYIRKLLPGR